MNNFDSNYIQPFLEGLHNLKQELKSDFEAKMQTLKEDLRKELKSDFEAKIQTLKEDLRKELKEDLTYKIEAMRTSYDLYVRMSKAVDNVIESTGHYRRKGNGFKTTKVEWVEEPEW